MSKNRQYRKAQRSFEQGRISRRAFLQSAVALGVSASAPLALGAHHAAAQAAENYDYIVIGAGAAGCALAARLSENPKVSVLVLEAGPPDENQFIHIPATFPNLFKTALDWDYSSTEQPGLNGGRVYIPRGKVYGGSTSMNAMIYKRGHPSCFDAWGADNPGWSYEEVLPLFKRAENNERGESDLHGVGGPLNVADLRDPNVLSRAFVAAAVEQGYAEQTEFNQADQEGFGLYQVTQKNGMRNSTAVAYLHPALERDNIVIQGEALVQKLLMEDDRCVGVAFEAGGETFEVGAKKEVILSAGTIGSPQILMLSGIGPANQLESLGIDVVADLPGVGENLQDHYMVPVAYSCTKPVSLAQASKPEEAEKLTQGMGLLTSNIGEGGGYLTVMEDAKAPDLQFHFGPTYFIADGAGNPEGDGFTLLPGVVGTRSVGNLTLASSDPQDKPLINSNVYADERDLDVVVAGVKIAREIAHSAAFDEFRGEEVLPGAAVTSDDDIREFIRGNTQTIYHPVGTCKMGKDAMAVVDAELRVHNLKGLRVADASIMPTIVNGNTNAASIMIGEKCSDLLRA
ncbi:MAG: GMC family oxidoreductase N-terminal domain-containing protein [Pseudomonadota bacterium]